jgi:hypothetical protein
MDAQSRRVRLPSTQWWANSNTDADRNSYGYINPYSYSDSNCYSHTDTNGDSKAYTYTKAESHAKTAPESATQAVTPACLAVVRRLPDEGEWSVIVIRLCQGYGEQVSER